MRYYAGMEQITDPDSPRFLTLAEAAERLRVNPSTLSRQCANGLFPHVRVGRVVRIPAAELERLEAGEPARSSMLDVPDYGTGTPSMFNGIPEADSPEDVDERPHMAPPWALQMQAEADLAERKLDERGGDR